ncbi:MAG: hypothetical protein E7176_00785 [Erysipelotrichaceae bacterium]|nr:hypothetical protein [Erysipelotrichaceae bacterium]
MQITMDRLKRTAKIKLIIMALATLLPILILICMELIPSFANSDNAAFADLIIFRYGIFVLLEGYIGIKIYTYAKILLDVDFASNELIKKNDERISFIKLKTNNFSLKLALYSIGIALIVTAFINKIIFYTLLAVLTFFIISYICVRIYYSKKY